MQAQKRKRKCRKSREKSNNLLLIYCGSH